MRSLLVGLFVLTFLTGSGQDYIRWYNEGVNKYKEGKYNEAIGLFSKVVAQRDQITNKYKVADAYLALSKCRVILGNYHDALKEADAAITLKPKYADGYVQRAKVLEKMGRFAEQISALDSAIRYKPMEEGFFIDRSFANEQAGNYEQALIDIKKGEEINPSSHLVYRQKGSALARLNRHEEAIVAYNKAILLNPSEVASLMNRGLSKAELKKYDSAQIDMNKAAEMDTSIKCIAYNNIAFFVKFAQEDYEGAIDYFDKAIALMPDKGYAYNNRGYALYKLKKYKEALKDIRRSLDRDPKNSYAYRNLALVYIDQGKTTDACEALKKAKALYFTRDYGDEVDRLVEQHCK